MCIQCNFISWYADYDENGALSSIEYEEYPKTDG